MSSTEFPITTASGMGPLPEWLQTTCGARPRDRAFKKAGVPEAVLHDRALMIPMQSMIALFARAAREAGDPVAGLRIGMAATPGDLGLWPRFALGGTTLRAALTRLAWSMPLFQRGPVFGLSETRAGAIWSYRIPRFRNLDQRHHSEHAVPMMVAFLRLYLGRQWRPQWVQSDTPEDGRADLLAETFGVPWRMGGIKISIPLAPDELDCPPCDPTATAQAPTSLEVRARLAAPAEDTVAALRACILLDLAEERTGIDHAAARLGTSVRGLQRRLTREGVSYREVLSRLREDQAKALLRETPLSVAEIAQRLGYHEPSNFTRAFTGWTGLSPTAYAEQRRQSADVPLPPLPLQA